MAKLTIELRLHPHQDLILNDPARYRVLCAGRRWGKTILAVNELWKTALDNPGSLNWYVAPTYKQAKMIAWELMKRLIPKDLIKATNEVELAFTLINNSKIELKGAENEDTLVGVGLKFVVLDENALMKRHVWPQIVRPMLTDTKGKALFISTPRGKDAFWELWLKGQKGEDGFKSWTFKTVDNPFIDPEEVESAKRELPDKYFKQEYEASFEDYTGLVYPEFDEKVHVIAPIALPINWPKVGAIDTALHGITAALKARVGDDGTLYFYSEYYEADRRVSDVVPAIEEEGTDWFIDPASQGQFTTRDGKLYTLFNEYVDYGIYCRPGENNVNAGINRVGEYLKSGKIKIFSTCKKLIWELERYHWSEDRESKTGILEPKPYKEADHLMDCLRYLVASRPRPSDSHGDESITVHSPDWFHKVNDAQKKMARVMR